MQTNLDDKKGFLVLDKRVYVDGKPIGQFADVAGVKVFELARHREEHLFKIYHGYGLSKNFLGYLVQIGVEEIHLLLDGKRLGVLVKEWIRSGMEVRYEPYEPQIVLREEMFITLE